MSVTQVFSNSLLVNYTLLSPNYSKRTVNIDTITIHCMAFNGTVEVCGKVFQPTSKQASSNYGIGSDGRIGLYVEEKNRSWCSSNSANDNRAVTIEVANDGGAPDWHVSDKALESLIKLVIDICKRNNIKELRWENNKSLIGQIDRQNMTLHRWFANKSCPGNYLVSKHPYIVEQVNNTLKGDILNMTKDELIKLVQDTVSDELNKQNKLYRDLKDLPDYWYNIFESLLEDDIINGGTSKEQNPTDINLHLDTIKAIAILYRLLETKGIITNNKSDNQ